MLAEHYGPDCPAALVYHASWPDEKIIRGTLADVAERVGAEGITRTAMFLVGHASGPAGAASLEALRQDVRARLSTRHVAVKIAAISLSREGAKLAVKLAAAWPACDVFLHAGVTGVEMPSASVSTGWWN